MKLSLPPGNAAGKDLLLSSVEWIADADASCGEPRMAVGVNVPEAMGWSMGGVRKPLAAPLEDVGRERKLGLLDLGVSVLGVEEDADG